MRFARGLAVAGSVALAAILLGASCAMLAAMAAIGLGMLTGALS